MSTMKVSKRIVLNKDTDMEKVKQAVEALAEADKENGDLWEDLGIIVDDLADCAKAPSKSSFQKQKADLLRTLKQVEKTVRNRLVYKK